MKLLQRKQILGTVLLSCTLLFTINAYAQETGLAQNLTLSVQVQKQKQKVQRDLSAELAHSIKAELDRFSTRYNTVKTQELAVVSKQKKLATKKQQTSAY
ncbi:MAG: cell division protein FtsB [Cognaticolwellia sp.]|jgi:cell division protein FtsB